MNKLPHVSPLTLTRVRQPFDHPDWVFELKHDGFRAVAHISTDGCRLVSRRDNQFRRFNPLCEILGNLPVKSAILDGEIVSLDGEGTSRFNQLLFLRGQPYFYAFDLVWLNGKDLRNQSLIERKSRLKDLTLASRSPVLLYADHVDQHGVDFFRMICEKDLEGIVAKHRDSRYDATSKWIKIKNPTYTQAQDRHELFERRKKVV